MSVLALSTTVTALAVGAVLLDRAHEEPAASGYAVVAQIGAPKLKKSYEEWKTAHETQGGDRDVRVALGYRKGLSSEFTRASGSARIDLIDGRVEVEVSDLPDGDFDVWLV